MGLFVKTKKNAGWVAVSVRADGICAASVKRASIARPTVELATFYPSNKSSVSSLLEKLAKDLHLDRFGCSSLLGAGDYQFLSVDAPNVPAEELKTAIRWRLKDMLDFHVDDATIDVLDVPVDKNAASRNHSMYAVAARNQQIEQHQALFVEAKIPLSVIDIPEMAQRNIAELLEPEGRGIALLSFDAEGGLLTVTFAGELYMSRRIDVTLQQLMQNDAEQKNACFEKINLELQRSLDHCDRQYHSIAIAKLVLAPLGDKTTGLAQYLTGNLYIPVEELNLETVLDVGKVPELKSLDIQQRYFMAIGAALRHEETVL
ncbi:MAG: agglutinin biogenesis protein MshI [Burkholderiaceae bacterium]